jgi:hypothetical protein
MRDVLVWANADVVAKAIKAAIAKRKRWGVSMEPP